MTAEQRRLRERRAEFGRLWISAIEKLGAHFCLPRGDLSPETREKIDLLERNARNVGGVFAAGMVSAAELRATIALWSDAVREASMAFEPVVLS